MKKKLNLMFILSTLLLVSAVNSATANEGLTKKGGKSGAAASYEIADLLCFSADGRGPYAPASISNAMHDGDYCEYFG